MQSLAANINTLFDVFSETETEDPVCRGDAPVLALSVRIAVGERYPDMSK